MAQSSHGDPGPFKNKGTDQESTPPNKGLILPDILSDLGLRDLLERKLSLSSVLEINRNAVSDEPVKSLKQLPMSFLKKLMISNLNSRNINCKDQGSNVIKCSLSAFRSKTSSNDDAINPLDLITALFHCSDPFLQQEIVSKMSMCQFAVPLLLPNCDTEQTTLMLWTMRDLVKKFKPHCSAGDKAFVEGRVVEMDMPMLSFVRLGKSSLPKSQTINKLVSNNHQHNHIFVHCDMECGNIPRKISDGLVEISWYLPCGNPNIDIFTQPVAIANLRGNGRRFRTQLSFLSQTSAAVFIFSDDLRGDLRFENNTELFLVTNSQRNNFNVDTLLDTCKKYNIKESNVIIKNRENDADFVKALCQHVNHLLEKNLKKMKVEDMADVARHVNIVVDEDETCCKNGRQNSELITKGIKDVMVFKEKQLPMHGNIWKEISQLEKEKCRLRKADREQSIEHYRSSLIDIENDLREKQRQMEISEIMVKFIEGISQSGPERLFFLKWLKIQLDTLSRSNLSTLREQYKQCCKNTPQNKDEIAGLDEQISKSSLGPEHFFRELGQLYESTCSLPEYDPARKQVKHLPALCAQMLLDGFPIELVDGDSSNIPIKWISEVFTQLHNLLDTKSRIMVFTVLGVQSTGKSTLLNTMFGVQFAVSSGRCTRGAFIQLIKVSEELQSELKCDFIMVIDTEGLKSPELAALDTSYEHDNELATLVIGLSDITIINVPMENSTEMKDILQIVVHAFLRMTEVGKKPRCVFVHQNVSDMAAHDSTIRDRKKLLEQLDEMTQIAAKMEKREANAKFTDVMEYDPDKDTYYIPGLWYGTPPMAPVNAGYSEAVYKLKKSLISSLQTAEYIKGNDAIEFLKWTECLWNAVKLENFIFNFRNSLVAHAYSDLCAHYNSWEWSFQKEMGDWLITQETMISNYGLTEKNVQIGLLRNRLQEVLHEASKKLHEEEQKILTNIDKYFEKKDSKVSLVEKYRQDFRTSAKSLKQGTENSIKNSLDRVVEIRIGMDKVNKIKNKQIDTIETKVQELLKTCREKRENLPYNDLLDVFENMWAEVSVELSGNSLPETDVYADVLHLLRENLNSKSGKVSEMLNKIDLKKCGEGKFTVAAEWFSDWTSSLKKFWSHVKHMDSNHFIAKIQDICDDIVSKCDSAILSHINKMEKNNTDYHGTYIKEILNIVDDHVKRHQMTDECEAYLKFYVCGYAARLFQEKHREFNTRNDPQKHLLQTKNIFQKKFLESFCEKDQCQKKAVNFIETCVKPAVLDYVSKHLGQKIVDVMKTGEGAEYYRTPALLQFAILKKLLEEGSFQRYMEYTRSYETFMKNWIKQIIVHKMSECGKMSQLEKDLLSEIIKQILHAITSSSKAKDLEMFIGEFCTHIKNQLVFPQDVVRTFLSLNEAKTDQFAMNLKAFVNEMKESLDQEYDSQTSEEHVTKRITGLPSKPHELLFSSLCGCGQQCPFCGTPCEAGGQGHTEHFSNMHRPVGLGHRTFQCYRVNAYVKLETDICTSLVLSGDTRSGFFPYMRYLLHLILFKKREGFMNEKTKEEMCPYKEYRKFYPDWEIKGDPSIRASDYWKYVMMTFNQEFSKALDAEPAEIPPAWKTLTAQDALNSLKRSFNLE